jgi:hypothetical protein
MEIVEIVMCFSPDTALDIMSCFLLRADSFETAVSSGVESFVAA